MNAATCRVINYRTVLSVRVSYYVQSQDRRNTGRCDKNNSGQIKIRTAHLNPALISQANTLLFQQEVNRVQREITGAYAFCGKNAEDKQ